ncbi:peptidoglycan DD-metalloendopeptidase family protein [Streptomyces sp. NPDC007851]|uniref:M23 family metallopeptidase n=1 Tax=Streptomyces sp. NPDC007851 TaxID=3155008 RepID=UPI0033D0D1F8
MRARGTGLRGENESHLVYGQSLYAPCDGTVVSAADHLDDQQSGMIRYQPPYGNHVFIDTGAEIIKLAHLRRGTVTVRTGDPVHAGQLLGEVGNSGDNYGAPPAHPRRTRRPRARYSVHERHRPAAPGPDHAHVRPQPPSSPRRQRVRCPYRRGATGRGSTIAIVDAYGSRACPPMPTATRRSPAATSSDHTSTAGTSPPPTGTSATRARPRAPGPASRLSTSTLPTAAPPTQTSSTSAPTPASTTT